MSAENIQGASQKAIQHHYDVDDDFYSLWLDPSMTYSCALFESNDSALSLERAQQRKLDYHLDQALVTSGSRFLDIGCGWGSLLRRVDERFDSSSAVGLTLSRTQAKSLYRRPIPNTEILLERWEEHDPKTDYDAIISIGAFEHFARLGLEEAEKRDVYRRFFEACHRWLRPGGRLSLQTITHGNLVKKSPFMAQEIFPESDLPLPHQILETSLGLFEPLALRNDRRDYEKTCKMWRSNLKKRRPEAIERVGEEIVKRYEKYLALSSVGFHLGAMHLTRWTFQRVDAR